MFKKLELFGSVFLWLIIFVKKIKRRGRETVKLISKVMEIHYYISVGTLILNVSLYYYDCVKIIIIL